MSQFIAPGALIVIVGFVVWLLGYAVWRIALVLMGAVYGYMIGTALVGAGQETLSLVVGVVGAIVLALIAYVLWSIAALIYGMFLGMGLGAWVASLLNAGGKDQRTVFVVIGAVIGLILAFFLKDQIIMLTTSFSGAAAVLYGAQLSWPQVARLTTGNNYFIGFVIWLVAGIVGYGVQNSLFDRRLTGTYGGYRRAA
jgi:Domain of unknown function (DUF4203)